MCRGYQYFLRVSTKTVDTFKPVYIWPNPAFPFRMYYDGPECRIFIMENLTHNWPWMKEVYRNIRPTDYFFVVVGCYYEEFLFKHGLEMLEVLGLNIDNFIIMCNDSREGAICDKLGLNSCELNHNAWLDYDKFRIIDIEKKYDAVYSGRLVERKRHYLSKLVPNMALISGDLFDLKMINDIPPHSYRNEIKLTPDEVYVKMNESRCGLILSEKEGACYSSSEYLLCGIPVVSTKSYGGRDVWYDEYNSRVVDPDPELVRDAVRYFVENPRDPVRIRNIHISKSEEVRGRFCKMTQEIFDRHGVSINAVEYLEKVYSHKLIIVVYVDYVNACFKDKT